MAIGRMLNGKPCAGNAHVRFDEEEVVSAATPRCGSLHCRMLRRFAIAFAIMTAMPHAHAERLRLGALELGFTVELGMAGTNAVVSFDERAMASFREEISGGRRVGVWKGHPICGADFEVRAEAEKGGDGSWRYSYSYSGNASDRFLRRVKFPELSAPVDAHADVLVPYSMGMLVHYDWSSE